METKAERYAWLVAYELNEAEGAASVADEKDHRAWARLFSLKRDDAQKADD